MRNQNVNRFALQPLSTEQVAFIARSWIGTPYHHQESIKGIGTDCLGLVRGVWRELYGYDAENPPRYTRDWSEASGHEAMLAAARRHLVEKAVADVSRGDVLVFRLRDGAVAKHAGIAVARDRMVHAQEGAVACEIALSNWWRRRLAGVFAFPGVIL